MGDAKTDSIKLERSEGTTDGGKMSTLGGELLISKSTNDMLLKQQCKANDLSFLPSATDLLMPLSMKSQPQECKAPTHEKRGNVDVTVDENGQVIEVKGLKGITFTKQADGSWEERLPGAKEGEHSKVYNVKVDCNGDVFVDFGTGDKVAHTRYGNDGSFDYEDKNGKWKYNPAGQMIEAPAGDGTTRKFHYTGKQLDEVEGRLGHWKRHDDHGHITWENKEKGLVWDGDMKVGMDLSFMYKSNDGNTVYTFDIDGKDLRKTAKDYDSY